jgi:hypothetical protein
MDEARQATVNVLQAERRLTARLLNGHRSSPLATLEDIARLEAKLASLDKRLVEAATDADLKKTPSAS